MSEVPVRMPANEEASRVTDSVILPDYISVPDTSFLCGGCGALVVGLTHCNICDPELAEMLPPPEDE